MKRNIAIVCGGDSSEHEVSIKSGKNLLSMIDQSIFDTTIVKIAKGKWVVEKENVEYPINKHDFSYTVNNKTIHFDCAYITIHGTPGENGILQSYFELVGIPHTSCGVFESALTFNKFACKAYLNEFGIKSAKAVLVRKGMTYDPHAITKKLGFPCFVKPNNAGSSCGVSKVKAIEELEPAINKALEEDSEVIIEEFLTGIEITNGIFKTSGKVTVLPITEIVSENEFFDYEAKYTGKSKEITPARLSHTIEEQVKGTTKKIYELLGCSGIVRVDYIVYGKEINMLEVNTTPGMSPASIIPQQITAMGLHHKDVFNDIIMEAINKKK